MSLRVFALRLAALAVSLGLSWAHGAPEDARAGEAPASAIQPLVAPSLGWAAIERRVLRGIERGVARFSLELADRDDVVAMALEKAWLAFSAEEEPVRHPEAWGRVIAERVALDELRRKRRERVHCDPDVDALQGDLCDGQQDPLACALDAERRAVLARRIRGWEATERRLARALMDGEASSVTAAAALLRAEDVAAGRSATMYPLKARRLLDARRGDVEDLV